MSKSKSYTTIQDEDFLEFAEETSKSFSQYTREDIHIIDKKSARIKPSGKSKRKNSGSSTETTTDCATNTESTNGITYGITYGITMNRLKQKGNKQWVHPPESLLRGHIVYNVKFLGHVEVDQPKGTEVVRDAIRKMKFNKQLKKAEGQKPPRVELTISVDGVTVQDPKSKIIMHQYKLHRISYCADDKTDKRMLTFIAKEAEKNRHQCFVFDSDKCAEEITLSIGQAFDLAYRKFLDSSSKDMDMKKQYLLLQKKVQHLTDENLSLKAKVADLERLLDSKANENKKPSAPIVEQPVVGRRLENLLLEEKPYTNGTHDVYSTPHKQQSATDMPKLAPPPPIPTRSNPGTPIGAKVEGAGEVDLFGLTPFNPTTPATQPSIPPKLEAPHSATNPFSAGQASTQDPFGMGSFNTPAVGKRPTTEEIDQQIQNVDRELMDLQTGFNQGISFGTSDDFSLADLDPLND